MCLVAWPLYESEAGVDLVMIETPRCYSYVNDASFMLISLNLHKKRSEVSIETRPTSIGHFRVHLSLHFKARLSAKSLL